MANFSWDNAMYDSIYCCKIMVEHVFIVLVVTSYGVCSFRPNFDQIASFRHCTQKISQNMPYCEHYSHLQMKLPVTQYILVAGVSNSATVRMQPPKKKCCFKNNFLSMQKMSEKHENI